MAKSVPSSPDKGNTDIEAGVEEDGEIDKDEDEAEEEEKKEEEEKEDDKDDNGMVMMRVRGNAS